MSLFASAQRQASTVIGSRHVGAAEKIGAWTSAPSGRRTVRSVLVPPRPSTSAPKPVLVGDVAVGEHGEAGQLLFLEDDRDELAREVAVLFERDLSIGQPTVGVSEEIRFAGPRFARVVGGERGEQVDDSLNMGTGREIVRALCRFRIGCRRCRLACRARR